jgi:hypothetical protein
MGERHRSTFRAFARSLVRSSRPKFDPQGDASICLLLPQEDAEALAALLVSAEASAALARLFLAGVAALGRQRWVQQQETARRRESPDVAIPGAKAHPFIRGQGKRIPVPLRFRD